MLKRSLMTVVILGCAVAMLAGGCRKKPGAKPLDGQDKGINITDINGPGGAGMPGHDTLLGKTPMPVAGLDAVLFAYDSAQVEGPEKAKLDAVAAFMKSNPQASLVIEGNCDERGTTEYNVALGDRRALACRAYLMVAGTDGARIQTKSLGKEQPLDPGHDEAAWAKNRRAEFKLYQ